MRAAADSLSRIGRQWLLVIVLVILLQAMQRDSIADVFKPEERLIGMLSDGTRVAAPKLTEWHTPASQPKIGNSLIFDANNPVRWIIDQAVPLPSRAEAGVEFFGGDCFPGRVVEYEPAHRDSFFNVGEFLVVEPLIPIDLPGQPATPYLRISVEWLKRVVFARRSGSPMAYRPGTAFLRDGSSVSFRVARWAKQSVSLLTEDGVRSLLFSQLAELHLPEKNGWEVWFDKIAALSPNLDARLFQLETSDGLRLTASTKRLFAGHSGDASKSENWYPQLQPAWSLDPFIVFFKTVRSWRFFKADAPPMTLFDPRVVRAKPVFSGGWRWQRDRSVQQTSMRNNKLLAGWGFGVHAPTELSLPLHPAVNGFRCRAGLDDVVRKGGCVRAVVALSSNPAAPLYRSDHLIGSATVVDTNWVNVPAPKDPDVRLLLTADPAITDRPKGADPFDIRDSLNWMEPEWRLDPARLKVEVAKRRPGRIPSLKGWKITSALLPDGEEVPKDAPAAVQLLTIRDILITQDPRYRLMLVPASRFCVFTSNVPIGAGDRWLALCVSRPKGTPAATLRIRGDGRALIEGTVPERISALDPEPILVPVSEFQDKVLRVEVVVAHEGDIPPQLDWRGAVPVAHHPGLVRLFDDQTEFVNLLTRGEGDASIVTENVQHGKAALKVGPVERSRARMPNLNLPLREYPALGEYRYLRFAWKKDGGQGIGLQLSWNGQLGLPQLDDEDEDNNQPPVAQAAGVPLAEGSANQQRNPRRQPRSDNRGARFAYQYEAGPRKQEGPTLVLNKSLPTDWVLNTRDLFGEFGAFDLTGLGFLCPDGTASYFDHIYLARTQADFARVTEWIDAPEPTPNEDPNIVAQTKDPVEFHRLLKHGLSQFYVTDLGDSLTHLAEYSGRKNVIRTMPPAQGKPCVLRAPLSVRAGKKTVLHIATTRHEQGDWQLIVKVGAEQLHASMVDANTAKADAEKKEPPAWVEHQIDLSKFAGKNILLEVHNHANNWSNEYAYWKRLEVVEQ